MQAAEFILVCMFTLVISYVGVRLRLLTINGSIGAIVVGIIIYIGFSIQGLVLLGCFFGSSSLLSKYKSSKKAKVQDILQKGDCRDLVQVMANGGVPALLGVGHLFNYFDQQTIIVGFSIAVAAANADTWASELGTLSKQKPRILFTFKQVERGTSGAVSILGTVSALIGSAFISLVAGVLFSLPYIDIIIITLFGFIGCFLDTLLGYTFQLKYICKSCKKITEKQTHCHVKGEKVKKYSFLNNDGVNLTSILLTTGLYFFIIGFYNVSTLHQ